MTAERPKAATTRTRRARLARHLYGRGWAHDVPRDGLRRRVYELASHRGPWWDWGHPLMILVGVDDCGNRSEANPPTWFYRFGQPKRMPITGYPLHPLSTIEVITSYAEFTARTKGMNEDQLDEWKAISTNQDGDLHLGRQFWGGPFFDLNRWEQALLRRYLRHTHIRDWFGARRWLYSLALHGAVNRKQPFRCHATPSRNSNGYSHWFCGKPRRHTGPHRFGNCTWNDGDLVMAHVEADRG